MEKRGFNFQMTFIQARKPECLYRVNFDTPGISGGGNPRIPSAYGETLPMAICLAALKAV